MNDDKIRLFQKPLEELVYRFSRRLSSPVRRNYDELPHVEFLGDYSFIRDVVVGIDQGLWVYPCVRIVKECRTCDNPIFFENKKVRVSARKLMSLVMLEASKGSLLDIFVKGKDAEAARIAVGLYAGVTTLGEQPNFKRFG